jgi:DNA polymerase-3 subunit alpha
LSSEPLVDVMPIHRRADDGARITGFDGPSCEYMGSLKMDFLGLRNLTVISDAVLNVKANRGIDVDMLKLPLDDAKAYELLAAGKTLGVFQLDSTMMRDLTKLMAPARFEDISAVLALGRPGPMEAKSHINYALRKSGQQPVSPVHPELKEPLEEILGETYHLVVYQEQVMAIARKLAGYTLGGADILRRAMGKKKKEEMDKQWAMFSSGMKENGYSEEATQAVWDVLLPFSAYGFNKSHTAGYGLVSYWTAYLKANYPAEYMAALLTSVGTNKDKMAVYLAETRRMGVKVLPPDVNESQLRFAAVGDDIRFGLGAIRNVGENVVDGIISARTAQGRFGSFNDFLTKVPLPVCNKRVVESLVKAGGFDSLGHPRKGLILVHEQAVDAVISVKRNEAIGQDSLFGPMDGPSEGGSALEVPIPDSEWSQQDTLAFEREMLGLYVSSHPLDGAEALLERSRDHSIADILDGAGGNGSVRVAGIITAVTKKITKQGNVWALVGIEDHEAALEVACFPNTYQLYVQALIPDAVVSITGKIRKSETSDGNTTVSFSAELLEVLDVTAAQNGALPPVVLNVREDRITSGLTDELKRILQAHPGNAPVHMNVSRPGRAGGTRLNLTMFSIEPTNSFMADIKSLLGPTSVAQ